jgi:aldehyde oxidoreductase
MRLIVNGKPHTYQGSPAKRLSDVLRDDLGLTGTKVGCNAGDCGACTVMIDGHQVCACLTAVGQAAGRPVVTVEGLKAHGTLSRLQTAFLKHGAAQCGICTPGMLMAATDLLAEVSKPDEQQVMDAIGGVLCRCTGYRKIVEAVLDATRTPDLPDVPQVGTAVGARSLKVDGVPKVEGTEKYGADYIPADALWLRVIRSPHARASFTLGDFSGVIRKYGLERVFTAADVPRNGFAIFDDKDQPVLADGIARYRGEAVVALLGPRDAVEALKADELPIHYTPEEAVSGVIMAAAPGAKLVQADKPENVLIRGNVAKGDVATGFAQAAVTAEGLFQTSFVEHAYIEPEAGWGVRIGDRIEIHASTQAPYMDRDEVAGVMQLPPDRVRIVPTACGGGFGGKLDVSVQPLIALAAWHSDRPVALVYTRPESMASSTKRHPARIRAKFGAANDGRLVAVETHADFDTGAYASWGPTVANRVPVHASGPYHVPHVQNRSRALFTNAPPSGAFRGFGVPQAAIAHETLMDDLAGKLGIDRLEMRYINAIRAGDLTATSQKLEHSAGLSECIAALRPQWQALGAEVEAFNARRKTVRRGIGIGCMWYGLGNTSISNPSTMRIGLRGDGRVFFYNGAVDIGQGSNTIFVQIVADALGVSMDRIDYVMGDTDRTEDAGKTSASRQTFVSGKATQLAAQDLRAQILRLANAGEGAKLNFDGAVLTVEDAKQQGGTVRRLDLATLPRINDDGDVLLGSGRFDPPTTMLDANGQGVPYATYGFAAQMALVEVDTDLGTVKVKKIIAAHDVGKAVNPTQVEGQIHGGIAQGLGLALMEEYLPGRTENLHDYLIPTVGDVPEIDVIMIEDAEPLGPFGAKGVGEPGLVPTAPAILGAIRHATGVRVTEVPVLPHRLHAALKNLPQAAE